MISARVAPPPAIGRQAALVAKMAVDFSNALTASGGAAPASKTSEVRKFWTQEPLSKNRASLEALDQELSRGDFIAEKWVLASRAFCRAGEELALAARDMAVWDAPADGFILRLAGLVRETAAHAASALEGGFGPQAQKSLALAKSGSLDIQGVFRRARAAAQDAPEAVKGLKAREIYRRLSEAGLALDRAAETLAWALSSDGGKEGRRAH